MSADLEIFMAEHWLDIVTTVLGLCYLWLEYRANIALWVVGIIMPALDVWLYWQHGLYGDAGMSVYYVVAAVYGYLVWTFGRKKRQGEAEQMPITHFRRRLIAPTAVVFFVLWAVTYYILVTFTDSTIPLCDSFTNALSFVGLWALSRKYVEQWCFWLVVDAVSTYLYISKGIPFKAGLYALYTVIAVMGYFKWMRLMREQQILDSNDVAEA